MPGNQLTLKDLKSELWRCAEILRGSAVDRTDWKGYILPLLFFKRISDVWDEETAEAREKRIRTLKTLVSEPFGARPQAAPEEGG